jgi:hypothetical protein
MQVDYFLRLHVQNNQNKMNWSCGSDVREPALQDQSPEFKPQSRQKKKRLVLTSVVSSNGK